jgi:hypothetical protein
MRIAGRATAAILIFEEQHLKTTKYRRNIYEIVDNT